MDLKQRDLKQWERILESTNHVQRLHAEELRKKTKEEKIIKWLNDKNISEEELFEHGYRREKELERCITIGPYTTDGPQDEYECVMRLTGKSIGSHIFYKDKHYEEERMIEIADATARQLNVSVNNIVLTKVVGKKRKCQVLVTVLDHSGDGKELKHRKEL